MWELYMSNMLNTRDVFGGFLVSNAYLSAKDL